MHTDGSMSLLNTFCHSCVSFGYALHMNIIVGMDFLLMFKNVHHSRLDQFKPCVNYCSQCLNGTACEVCQSGYYLLNSSTCVSPCPSGYWQNNQTQTCDVCDSICQTCSSDANNCTSCFTPYILDSFTCNTPPGISPPTAVLESSSDPETFLLVFSNPMAVTADTLSQNLQFSLTGMTSADYSLLSITEQSDDKTFKITFDFGKSLGVETLTAIFTNKKVLLDNNGLIIDQDSVSTQTIRFTYFSPAEKAEAQTITNIGSGVSNAALSSSVAMFLTGGAGGMLWAFLGLFQIVNYLLYLNVNYPYNVVVFFKIFSVSSISNMVPNPIKYLAPSIYQQMQAGLPSPPKFYDNSTDGLFLNNAGSTVAIWVIVGILYVLTKIILFTFRTSGRFNRIISSFKEKFEWGVVYNAMIGTYPDLIIASCLQFNNMDFTTPLTRFSSVLSLIVGGCCFWAPFAVTIALESPSSSVLGTEYHAKKHGALYEVFDIKPPKNVSPEVAYCRRNFMAFIFLRKIAYFSSIVLVYNVPILQMLVTCCSGLVLLIFMIKLKPYRHKRDAWMNVGSEVFMVIIHIVIFIFAGDDITMKLTDNQRKNVGWAVIFLCCTMVAYNAFFILTEQMFTLWRVFKLIARVICKKKKPDVSHSGDKIQTISNNATPNKSNVHPLPGFDIPNFLAESNLLDNPISDIRPLDQTRNKTKKIAQRVERVISLKDIDEQEF